jgi:hypothetical protein
MKSMEPQKFTNAEKLKILAQEVLDMLDKQQKYFKSKHAGTAPDELRNNLQDSIKQEARVKKLVDKILDPQATLPLE